MIRFDENNRPIEPNIYIAELDYTIIGALKVYGLSGTIKRYLSTMTFRVPYEYTDCNGNKIKNPYYDKVEGNRFILVEGIGWYVLNKPEIVSNGISEYKECTIISEEIKFSTQRITDFNINLGTEESIEWIYARSKYPSPETLTDLSSYNIDMNNITGYTDDEIIELLDADRPGDIGYVKFYNPSKPSISLMHILLSPFPNWSIGHVDYSLQNLIRNFSIDCEDILGFMTGKVSEAYGCTFIFNTLNHTVNVYEKDNVGKNTDIYISFQKLAKNINISYNTDDIKTKLRVKTPDGFSIRDVNGGLDSVMDLSFYHNDDWMGEKLCARYSQWLEDSKKADQVYQTFMSDVYIVNEQIAKLKSSFLDGYDIWATDLKTDEDGNYSVEFQENLTYALNEQCPKWKIIDKENWNLSITETFLMFYNQNVELIYDKAYRYGTFYNDIRYMWRKILRLMGSYYLDVCYKAYKNILDTLNESVEKGILIPHITIDEKGQSIVNGGEENSEISCRINKIKLLTESLEEAIKEKREVIKVNTLKYAD